jgi:hypothetical protein
MAAGEHHPQLAVLDLGVEKQFVESCGVRGVSGGPLPQNAITDLVAPESIEDLILGDAMDPPRRIVGNTANAPRFHCVQKSGLHHVLGEAKVPPAEDAGQYGHQAARLMAEEMLHERSDRFRLARGHGSIG